MPSTYIHAEIGEAESSQDTVLRNTTPAKKRRKPASTRRVTVPTPKRRKLNVCQKHFQFMLRGRELDNIQCNIVGQLDQTEQITKEILTERQHNDELLPLIEEMKVAAQDVTDAKQKLSLAGSTALPSLEVDDLIGEDPDSQWTSHESEYKLKSGRILHLLHKINAVRSTITNLHVDLQEARHGLEVAKTEYDADKEAEINEKLGDASAIHGREIAALHEDYQREIQEKSLSKKKIVDELISSERKGFESKLIAKREAFDEEYESAIRRHQTALDTAELAAKDKDRYLQDVKVARDHLTRANSSIDTLDARLRIAQAEMSSMSTKLMNLEGTVSTQDLNIRTLDAAKSEADAQIRVQAKEISQLGRHSDTAFRELEMEIDRQAIANSDMLRLKDDAIVELKDEVCLKDRQLSDWESAKSKFDAHLKSKSEEVFAQSDTILSRDAEISELKVAADTQKRERKKQMEFLQADICTERKSIIELEQAKVVFAEQLAEKVEALGQRESDFSDQARMIEELEKSKAREILKGQEASKTSANLQLRLNHANDRANRLSTELDGVEENAAAAKSKHSAEVSTAYARLKDVATELKARDTTLQEKEILAQTRSQRIEELEQEAKRDADQAFTERTMLEKGLEDRERQLTKEKQLTAALQDRINRLENAQAQSVVAQKESEWKAKDLQSELLITQRKAQGSEDRLISASSALAQTKSILEEFTTECTRLSHELTGQTTLAQELKQEMIAEKSQLLADIENIWVCKGDYQGVAVTILLYRSISQQRIVVALYQGDRKTFLWRGDLHQCVIESRGWNVGLCMAEGDQGSSVWVRLIDRDYDALGCWLAMEETNVLNRSAPHPLE